MFWPNKDEEGKALFYDKNGDYYDVKSVYLPFQSVYCFAEVPNLPGLTIFGDESVIEDSEDVTKRYFRLEYYRTIGQTIFGYYYEKDGE